jgi:hypothetical protein
MKLCALLALLLFATKPAAIPDRNGHQSDHTSNQEREPSVVVVNNQTSAPQADHRESKAPKWDASVWANWALVAVGIVTFFAVYYQARKTAEASQAMRRSIRLQEVALRQSVVIENWISLPHITEGGMRNLHVQFDIVNPTPHHMIFKAATVAFNAKQVVLAERTFLPTKQAHTVAWEIEATDEDFAKWQENRLLFHVAGYVDYEDVLEKGRQQPFSGLLVFGKDGGRFHNYHGAGFYIGGAGKKPENEKAN